MDIDPARSRAAAQVINRHLTPFALFLVVMAAASSGLHRATEAALAIAALTGIGNPIMVELMRRYPGKTKRIRNFRVGFNYFFNIVLLYLLWPYWSAIWMLLALSIIAVALFDSRKNTALTAVMFTAVVVVVEYLRGSGTWTSACQALTYIAAIWTAGLLISGLAPILER